MTIHIEICFPWGGLSKEYYTEEGLNRPITRAEVSSFLEVFSRRGGGSQSTRDKGGTIVDGSITDLSHLSKDEESSIYTIVQFKIMPIEGNKFNPYAGISYDEAVQFILNTWTKLP